VSIIGILVAGKFRTTCKFLGVWLTTCVDLAQVVVRRALARLFSATPLDRTSLAAIRSEFQTLENELASRISRISEASASGENSSVGEDFENNATLNRFAKLLLSALMDEAYSITCHPILRSPVADQWPGLLSQYALDNTVEKGNADRFESAIQSSQALCLKCAKLVSTPEFRCFSWSWPGYHQPLNAITLLLTDLIQFPTSGHAANSIQVVDLVFALLGPDGGIVAGAGESQTIVHRRLLEGGRESWQYIGRLRREAWRRAERDPAVVWTREQAIRFCNAQDLKSDVMQDTGDSVMDEEHGQEDLQLDFMDRRGSWSATSPLNIDWDYLDAVLTAAGLESGGAGWGDFRGFD
jgi:hypothetical protein